MNKLNMNERLYLLDSSSSYGFVVHLIFCSQTKIGNLSSTGQSFEVIHRRVKLNLTNSTIIIIIIILWCITPGLIIRVDSFSLVVWATFACFCLAEHYMDMLWEAANIWDQLSIASVSESLTDKKHPHFILARSRSKGHKQTGYSRCAIRPEEPGEVEDKKEAEGQENFENLMRSFSF